MKVAILSFYSGHISRGVEVWATSLKDAISSECDTSIISSTQSFINWRQNDSWDSYRRIFFLDYWSLQIAWFTISSLGQLRDADIVIPTNGGWQTLFVRIYTLITRRKMVVVGHSGIGRDDRWNLWCFPNLFVALSSHAKTWAKRVNPLVRTIYIPNGIDLDVFSPKGPKESLNMPHPIYLYVGALEAGKRPALAIEAVARLERGSFLMLGHGPLLREVDELGTELLGDRFKLLQVDHSKISSYYRACDIFTLPTWSREAFGMVYLEALACGLPVVASDDPVKREIVGNAGYFIDPTDPISYAEVLERVAKKDWGDAPRKQAEKFSWDIISRKYYDAFISLTK